jgi:cell fate (sporulation/competence/biofilm development) regulator YmcA (YheA/YmcA/DUF963 family)
MKNNLYIDEKLNQAKEDFISYSRLVRLGGVSEEQLNDYKRIVEESINNFQIYSQIIEEMKNLRKTKIRIQRSLMGV